MSVLVSATPSCYFLAIAVLISTSISSLVTTSLLLCFWPAFKVAFLLTREEMKQSRMVRIKNTAMPDDRMLTVTTLVPKTVVGVVPVST